MSIIRRVDFKTNQQVKRNPVVLRQDNNSVIGDRFSQGENTGSPSLIDPNKFKKENSSGSTASISRFNTPSYKLKTGLKILMNKALAVTMLAGSLCGSPMASAAEAVATGNTGVPGNAGFTDLADTDQPRTEMVMDKDDTSLYVHFNDMFDRVTDAGVDKEIGDYRLKVDYLDPDLKVKPRVKPKLKDGKPELGWKAEAKAKVKLMRTELSRTDTSGGWKTTQGLRGGLEGEWRFGYEGKMGVEDNKQELETIDKQKWRLNVDGFKRWEKDLGNMYLTVDAVGGVGHEFVGNTTDVHLGFRQKLDGDSIQIFGSDFGWKAEAKQQFSYKIQDGDFDASYELFAGLTKKVPMRVFRHEFDLNLEAGPKIKGDLDEPIEFKPVAKVKVDF
ncbi:MAG: hypothetical protein ACLFQV_14060 [Vulcanimicrobiota bacterium]